LSGFWLAVIVELGSSRRLKLSNCSSVHFWFSRRSDNEQAEQFEQNEHLNKNPEAKNALS